MQEKVFHDTPPSPPCFPFALLKQRTMSIGGKQQPRMLVSGKTPRVRAPHHVVGSVGNWQSQLPLNKRAAVTQFPPLSPCRKAGLVLPDLLIFQEKQKIVCNLPDFKRLPLI